jgi:hypothetical protein
MVLFGKCPCKVGVKRSQNNIKTGRRVDFGRASAVDLVFFFFYFRSTIYFWAYLNLSLLLA